MEKEEFIAKTLRIMQEQINDLSTAVVELRSRILSLEEDNQWNNAVGKTEQSPGQNRDEKVTKLASGRLRYSSPQVAETETETGTEEDGTTD